MKYCRILKTVTLKNLPPNLKLIEQETIRSDTLNIPMQNKSDRTNMTADKVSFTKQVNLQNEVKLAMAQVKQMARMQMEIESQFQQKNIITELIRHSLEKIGVSLPGGKRRLSRQILTEMNVAQLQVIANELHSEVETFNEALVGHLMERDDLHMEQDSMLVDLEDLTRYSLVYIA